MSAPKLKAVEPQETRRETLEDISRRIKAWAGVTQLLIANALTEDYQAEPDEISWTLITMDRELRAIADELERRSPTEARAAS